MTASQWKKELSSIKDMLVKYQSSLWQQALGRKPTSRKAFAKYIQAVRELLPDMPFDPNKPELRVFLNVLREQMRTVLRDTIVPSQIREVKEMLENEKKPKKRGRPKMKESARAAKRRKKKKKKPKKPREASQDSEYWPYEGAQDQARQYLEDWPGDEGDEGEESPGDF